MELKILGPVQALAGGSPMALGGSRTSSMLAVLALSLDQVVPMSKLIETMWDDDPPATAHAQVQIRVSGLRRTFTAHGFGNVIATRSPGYALLRSRVSLDADEFERLTAAARHMGAQGELAPASELLREALALWRGPALMGLDGRVVRGGAMRLDERRMAAIEERLRIDLLLERHADVVGELFTLVAEHPLREGLYAHLMTALFQSGRQAEALEVYRGARAILVEQLGIEPGERLHALEKRILSGRPIRGSQPLAARIAARSLPRQLPADIVDFIGRGEVIARIRDIVTDGLRASSSAPTVVVLSGPPGVGKSALGVHVAHLISDQFPDGQLHASLAGGAGPHRSRDVLSAFVRDLGVTGTTITKDVDELAKIYRDRMVGRRVLVVLDDAETEEQVVPLLPAVGGCTVIITSGRLLTGLSGAHQFCLPAFSPADSQALLAAMAGADRIAAEPAAGAELAHLCNRLPLALRVVGARLAANPHRPLDHLLRRMRDESRRLDELDHGGQGVRASMSASYARLRPLAQRLLRGLASLETPDFAGWVGTAILEVPVDVADDLIDELCNAHLLDVCTDPHADVVRYRMHDLVRVFARERAAHEDPPNRMIAAVRRTLAAWLTLAEEAHRREYGGDYTVLHGSEPRWALPAALTGQLLRRPMAWLTAERVGIISALRQAVELGFVELGWDLALTAVTLFETKGYFADWREAGELAFAASRRAGNARGTAAMAYMLGSLAMAEQRHPEASLLLHRASAGFAACGDGHGQALVARNLAYLDRVRGDREQARIRYTGALRQLRDAGDHIGAAHVLCSMAALLLDVEDHERARKLLDEALVICEAAASHRVEAQVLFRLGQTHLQAGETDQAAHAFYRVLRSARDRGDRTGEAYALLGLGTVRRRSGRSEQAELMLRQAVQIAEAIGDQLLRARARFEWGLLCSDQAHLDDARDQLTEAHQIFHVMGAAPDASRALRCLADVHSRRGDTAEAERLRARAALFTDASTGGPDH